MEARTTIRGAGVSKGLVAVVAVMVALALGAGAAVLARAITGSTVAPAAHVGQVTSGAYDNGPAWNYALRRGGVQTDEGPAAENSFLGPDALDRNSELAVPAAANSFLGPDAQERNSQLAVQPTFHKGYGY